VLAYALVMTRVWVVTKSFCSGVGSSSTSICDLVRQVHNFYFYIIMIFLDIQILEHAIMVMKKAVCRRNCLVSLLFPTDFWPKSAGNSLVVTVIERENVILKHLKTL
jgi:hypothetical protein